MGVGDLEVSSSDEDEDDDDENKESVPSKSNILLIFKFLN